MNRTQLQVLPKFLLKLSSTFSLVMITAAMAVAQQDYPPQVKEIVEQRCMVCHGCYDAPCQLKLDAWAGLQRGAHKDKVYDGSRLLSANMTRLFEDAQSVEDWRKKGFYPVLDDAPPGQDLLTRMLTLKRDHPLPAGAILPDSFDFSLNRKQQCPKPEKFDNYAKDYPLWGMPYGLPGLTTEEFSTLTGWLRDGAQGIALATPTTAEIASVQRWESFLNGRSLKQQLTARYIYEHLFAGDLYFSDLGINNRYYQLVRSLSAPGEPIDVMATRRPYESPGDGKFYYRLRFMQTSVLDKRHMPYALNQQRLERWQALFLDADYKVSALPSYKPDIASNPFRTFRELPQTARYKFMLDEAQFTIMGFIKGPVCRGQVALNVIDDHFWVVFMDPDRERARHSAEFLATASKDLQLPNNDSGLLVSLAQWQHYSREQKKFLKAKVEYIKSNSGNDGARINLDLIWDGEGENENASLTIFRHNDSASVVKGLVGQRPKTAWVIDYSLLERIHYLLVAGFDVYGSVGHQLETRLYMDFLRMEGEQNFLLFLPPKQRIALRDYWYRNARSHVKQFVLSDSVAFDLDTDIEYQTNSPKRELLQMLQKQLPKKSAQRYRVADSDITSLLDLNSKAFSFMPQLAFVDVLSSKGENRVYTLIHNNAYANNTHLFNEEDRRILEEDTLTVVRGFIGSYPNVFFQVPEKDIKNFLQAINSMESEQDYTTLVSYYGVRRNAPWFWQISDKLYQHYRDNYPAEAGLFDLNRYQNR